MSLKNIYYKLEDKYFAFLENLEKKKINLFKIVDPLEKKGIPTFPIFSLIIIGIIILILLLIFKSPTTIPQDQLNLSFLDEQNNPIANQEISFYLGTDSYTRRTDTTGVVVLKNLPDISYRFSLDDPNYETNLDSLEINLLEKRSYSLNLQEKEKEITKEISFLEKESGAKITDSFTVSFYCTNEALMFDSGTLEVINGDVVVENVPVDCGDLIPTILTPNINDNYFIAEERDLDTTRNIGEILLSPKETEYGSLRVSVIDAETKAVIPDIELRVFDWGANVDPIDVATTNNNGQFVFDNLPINSYMVLVRDREGIYSSVTEMDYHTGKQQTVQLRKNTIQDLTLELTKDVVGFFNFKVLDRDVLEEISNVDIKLYKNNELVSSATTDSEGKALISVSENISYNVVFDHDDYLLSSRTISPTSSRETTQEIKLTKVDQQTMQGVFISVVDSENRPVEFAKLTVYEHPEQTPVTTTTADIRGQAVISNLSDQKTYYIEASVREFSGKSENFEVVVREPTNVTVRMNIGEGTYDLSVLDNTKEPISTRVRVYDSVTDEELSYKATTTNNEGNTLIRIRADRFVYFVIDNFDSVFVTKKYNVSANTTFKETIVLPRQPTSNDVQYLGLYDHAGKEVTSVSSGQRVIARFVVNIIRQFDSVQTHIRTGQGLECGNRTYSVEQDQLYIRQVEYAGNKIVGSTSFTPCTGESIDKAASTRRDGKWFNVIMDKPLVGSYIVDAEIVIQDSVSGNLPLYYRSEFVSGNTVLRNPTDDILKTSTSHPEKQALYAYAKMENIFTGASNFCEDALCYYFSVFDKSTSTSRNIVDRYSASENTDYSLSFNFNFKRAIPNAVLRISSESSIDLDSYNITGVGAETITGASFDYIELGSIASGDHINGIVDLEVVDDQTDDVLFEIVSDGDVIFRKSIIFDIKPSKEMVVDVTPSVFVPFIQNNVIVGVEDNEEKRLSDVQVIVKHNSKTIETGITDKEGIFAFKLPAPNVGDQVEIILRKRGYRSINLKREVSKNIAIVTPDKIETQLNLSTEARKEINIDITNPTVLPFTITNISHTIPTKYLNLQIVPTKNIIEPGEKINIAVTLGLTEEGFDLMTQQNFSGDIVINLKDTITNQTWPIKIPTEVRITFGNSVDSVDCLVLEPTQVDIRTEPLSEEEITLTLRNDCRVNNEPISLGRINAKVNLGSERKVGDFSLIINNQTKPLSSKEEIILSSFSANQEVEIKLRYKAQDVRQATTTPKIEFKTQRANLTGVDRISSILETNIVINDFTKCLAIPKEPIPSMFCGMPPGQEAMQQRYFGHQWGSYDPTRFQNPYQYSSPIGNPQHMSTLHNQPYPNPMFTQGIVQHNYMSQQAMGQMGHPGTSMFGCPSTRIPIRNDCAEDVEVEFVADYGVTLKSDSVMTVERGKIEYVEITGGMQLGTFQLGVYARPLASVGDHSTFVGNIPIQILLPVEQIPEGCIVFSQRKFDFSSIHDHKPQTFTITNRCAAEGWSLRSVRITELKALRFENVDYFTFGDRVSEEVMPLRKTPPTQVGTEVHETWEFMVQRSPEIQTDINRVVLGKTPATQVTGLRRFFSTLGQQVKLEPIFEITYSTPRLGEEKTHEQIQLIDNLQWLGYIIDGAPDPEEEPRDPEEVTRKVERESMVDLMEGKDIDQISTEEGICFSPHLDDPEAGLTGEDNYKDFGFDRLLFSWKDVSQDACDVGGDGYYCDHTQLYDSLYEKSKVIDDKSNITTIKYKVTEEDDSEIIFRTNNDGRIKENNALKGIVVDVDEDTSDLSGIIFALKTIPEVLRKYAIIEFELAEDVTENGLKRYLKGTNYNKYKDRYQITTYQFIENINDYVLEVIDGSDTDEKDKMKNFLKKFCEYDIYYGYAINPTIVNLKELGDSGNEYNSLVAKTYNKRWLNTRKIKLENYDVNKPGTYEVYYSFDKKENIYEINIKNIDYFKFYNEFEDNNYLENKLFYTPINPDIFEYVDTEYKIDGPINFGDHRIVQRIEPSETFFVDLYTTMSVKRQWDKMQEGYIFKIEEDRASNKDRFTFTDVRPLHSLFNTRVLNYRLPNNYQDTQIKIGATERRGNYSYSNNRNTLQLNSSEKFIKTFFVTNTSTRNTEFIFSEKPTINVDLDITRSRNDDYIVTIDHPFDSYIRSLDTKMYDNIGSMIKSIENNNICFYTTEEEIKIWTNPDFSLKYSR